MRCRCPRDRVVAALIVRGASHTASGVDGRHKQLPFHLFLLLRPASITAAANAAAGAGAAADVVIVELERVSNEQLLEAIDGSEAASAQRGV